MTDYKVTTVSIPLDVWQCAKSKHINVSGFLATQLREYLESSGSLLENQNEELQDIIRTHAGHGVKNHVSALWLSNIAKNYGRQYTELKQFCDSEGITITE